MKCLVNGHKVRPMVNQINLDISGKIIHKYDKISRSPSVGTDTEPQTSECIRSKDVEEKELLLLKGNFVCLPKW